MKKKSILVNVHKSIPLLDAILAVGAKHKDWWPLSDEITAIQRGHALGSILQDDDAAIVFGHSCGGGSFRGCVRVFKDTPIIDAATEFGKLIELLEEKEKRIENIVFACSGAAVHGVVNKDGLKLEGGASGLVTRDKIKEIYTAMFEEEK